MTCLRGRSSDQWEHAGLNYMCNIGSGTGTHVDYGNRTDGLFWHDSATAFQDILDGTSSTIAFAETPMGPGYDETDVPVHLAGKFVATSRGRRVADMQAFRDQVAATDPTTFIESHDRWGGCSVPLVMAGTLRRGPSPDGRTTPARRSPGPALPGHCGGTKSGCRLAPSLSGRRGGGCTRPMACCPIAGSWAWIDA